MAIDMRLSDNISCLSGSHDSLSDTQVDNAVECNRIIISPYVNEVKVLEMGR